MLYSCIREVESRNFIEMAHSYISLILFQLGEKLGEEKVVEKLKIDDDKCVSTF